MAPHRIINIETIVLWDHCLVKLTFTWRGWKARATLFYDVRLLYHYHQLFIEIEREDTSCSYWADFVYHFKMGLMHWGHGKLMDCSFWGSSCRVCWSQATQLLSYKLTLLFLNLYQLSEVNQSIHIYLYFTLISLTNTCIPMSPQRLIYLWWVNGGMSGGK